MLKFSGRFLAGHIQGKYPISGELSMFWKKKKEIPGGMIIHSVSHLQQKVVWQYIWASPERWFWRISTMANYVTLPFLLFYIWMLKTSYDAEEYVRNHLWF